MTEAGTSAPDGFTPEDLKTTDYFLEEFIDLLGVEASDQRFSLTLMTSGGILSGEAVSVGTWEKEIQATLASAQSHGSVGVVAGLLHEDIEAIVAARKSRLDGGLSTPPPRFVHLSQARLWTGPHHRDVGLWRVRIERVNGWSFGSWR